MINCSTICFTVILLGVWDLVFSASDAEWVPGYNKTPTSSRKTHSKLIGAWATNIQVVPWQVSLGYTQKNAMEQLTYQHQCGGSIISQDWVLTAGHCVVDQNLNPALLTMVVAGTVNPYNSGSRHSIVQKIIHPRYYLKNQIPFNDIALLRVTKPFQLDATRQPVNMFEGQTAFLAGRSAYVSGWGRNENNQLPANLGLITMMIASDQQCDSFVRQTVGVGAQNQLCLNGHNNQKTCSGDSGAPLVIGTTQIGLVSWGYNEVCADMAKPSVFTSVSRYRGWVRDVSGV